MDQTGIPVGNGTTMGKRQDKKGQSVLSEGKSPENIPYKEKALKKEEGLNRAECLAQPKGVEKEECREAGKETSVFEEETTRKTKRKWLRWVLAAVVLLMVSLAGIYGGIALYYRTHFLPNTTINSIVCSNMKALPVVALLDAQIQEYALEVRGRDPVTGRTDTVLGTIVPSDIELAYADSQSVVDHLLSQQDNLLWIKVLANQAYSHSVEQGVVFDEKLLEEVIGNWDACQKRNMVKPRDAYIGEYSEAAEGYEIIPEEPGTLLDTEQVIQCVKDALVTHQDVIDLEEAGCYQQASVTSQDPALMEKVELAYKWLHTKITYDWNGNKIELGTEILKDWITMEESGPVLDQEAVAAFVKEQAKKWDTYGRKRKFVTTLGMELSLPSGYYGWQTDRKAETEKLVELICQGAHEEREPVYACVAMEKGEDDIGDSYVEADLSHQHLYLYIDGEIVLETDFVSGKMSVSNCITPPGVFGIAYKTKNAVLRGSDYETPVKYWMPYYGNYGMHDATWRRSFGGDIYLENGSHGCINLPINMASKIYDYMTEGFPVICYYYTPEQMATLNPELNPEPPPDVLPQEEGGGQQEPPVQDGVAQEPTA